MCTSEKKLFCALQLILESNKCEVVILTLKKVNYINSPVPHSDKQAYLLTENIRSQVQIQQD